MKTHSELDFQVKVARCCVAHVIASIFWLLYWTTIFFDLSQSEGDGEGENGEWQYVDQVNEPHGAIHVHSSKVVEQSVEHHGGNRWDEIQPKYLSSTNNHLLIHPQIP